ncbi:transposase [Kitasatospora sp. NPDC091257]|uniref:transposase n=1 Tax=Kitasatospora sp. NPDC091257 TaxID=3364084 RepID=UPI00381762E0
MEVPELSPLVRGRPGRCIGRRTDVAQVFPNDDAFLWLVTAVLVELHDEWIASPAATCPRAAWTSSTRPSSPEARSPSACLHRRPRWRRPGTVRSTASFSMWMSGTMPHRRCTASGSFAGCAARAGPRPG